MKNLVRQENRNFVFSMQAHRKKKKAMKNLVRQENLIDTIKTKAEGVRFSVSNASKKSKQMHSEEKKLIITSWKNQS